MTNIRVMHGPPRVHALDIPVVAWYGKLLRRSIGDANARAGERYLHHLLREITRGMTKPLVRRGDVDARRVIVRAEVDSRESSVGGVDHQRKQRLSRRIENDLRN